MTKKLCVQSFFIYTKLIKFFPTQRELKGLNAQVCSSRPNLSTYIHLGTALIDDNSYSRQLLLRCSSDSHPCENLIKINNAAFKPVKIALWELSRCSKTRRICFGLVILNQINLTMLVDIEKAPRGRV